MCFSSSSSFSPSQSSCLQGGKWGYTLRPTGHHNQQPEGIWKEREKRESEEKWSELATFFFKAIKQLVLAWYVHHDCYNSCLFFSINRKCFIPRTISAMRHYYSASYLFGSFFLCSYDISWIKMRKKSMTLTVLYPGSFSCIKVTQNKLSLCRSLRKSLYFVMSRKKYWT